MFRQKPIILTIFICISIVIINSPLHARNISLDNSLQKIPIGKYIDYLADEKGKLTLKDVISSTYRERWIPSKKQTLGFGFTETVYWVRFTIKNLSNEDLRFYLENAYPPMDRIELYSPVNDTCKTIVLGDHKPFHERPVDYRTFIFPLKLLSGVSAQYYIRYSTKGSMNIVLNLWSPSFFEQEKNREYMFWAMFFGIMMVMMVYNLMIYIFVRRPEYLYYVLFLLSLNIFFYTLNGIGFQYFYPNRPWLTDLLLPASLGGTVIFATLFGIYFMDPPEKYKFPYPDNMKYPILSKMGYQLLYISLLIFISSFFLSYRYSIIINAGLMGYGVIFAIFVGVIESIKGNRQAYFYLIAWLLLLAGGLLFFLQQIGIIPMSFATIYSVQFGTIAQVVLLGTALIDQINIIRKELAVLNEHLEDKVKERTHELQKANDELAEADRIHRKDVNMATVIQSTFLPRQAPEVDEYDLAFVFEPASGVSGDFYDIYHNERELEGVGIFDVSGHGISSGLLTLIAKSIIYRNFKEYKNENLSMILEKINSVLIAEIGQVDNYLTGILLKFSADTVDYVNSGHPDLIYRKAGSHTVKKVLDKDGNSISGNFLGLEVLSGQFRSLKIKVQSGDSLLLYTDSLNECKNSNGEEYGEARIIESLKSAPDGTAREVLDHVVSDFYNFINGKNNIDDDLTVMLIKKL